MIVVNLKNIEELILKNKNTHDFLPELRHIIEQWYLSYRIPFLRDTRRKALLDLLNALNSYHISKLEEYLGDRVVLDKIDYKIVRDVKIPLDCDLNLAIGDFNDFSNFTSSRDENNVYICFWK